MDLPFIIIGYCGSVFLSLSYVPQVIKAYRTDDIKSISLKFILLQLLTTLSFIVYSVGFFFINSNDGMPIFVANCWVLLCLLALLFRKLFYKRKTNEIEK